MSQGNVEVVVGLFENTNAGDFTAVMDAYAAWIYTLRDGKIVRCDVYPDRAEALEAAGLRE